MDHTELPKKYQEWGKSVEAEFSQAIADAAVKFQATEAEGGRVVCTTDAVHHVMAKGFGTFVSEDTQ